MSIFTSIDNPERKRRRFSRALIGLHYNMDTLILNGVDLIHRIRKAHEKGVDFHLALEDPKKLANTMSRVFEDHLVPIHKLVCEQEFLLNRIDVDLSKNNIDRVLAVTLPALTKQVSSPLFKEKGLELRDIYFSEEALELADQNLERIRRLKEQLREFIVAEFKLEELL